MIWSINENTKITLGRLLGAFESDIGDVVKLIKMFGIAAKIYSGRSRYGGKEPYINHALRVALILLEESKIHETDVISAGMLHDVLDNKGPNTITVEQLYKQCGQNICDMVKSVTEPVFGNENRDKLLDLYFQNISKAPKYARYIKLVDRLENIRFLKNMPRNESVLRYKLETQKYVMPIAEQTDETLALKLSIALYEIKNNY
jgi:GTP pyrophosphokinase